MTKAHTQEVVSEVEYCAVSRTRCNGAAPDRAAVSEHIVRDPQRPHVFATMKNNMQQKDSVKQSERTECAIAGVLIEACAQATVCALAR
jgi:hypothetical protein